MTVWKDSLFCPFVRRYSPLPLFRWVFWKAESQLQPGGFPEYPENLNNGLFPGSESLQSGSPSVPVSKEHGQDS